MIILGIDPGTATTGFAVVEKNNDNYKALDFGIFNTASNLKLEERISQIGSDLEEIIKQYKPEACGIEEVFFTNNIKTAISVSHARGVVMYILTKHKIPIISFTPTQLKSAITGYGKADKHQVQTMTKIILNLIEIPKPDDAADALAIAIACGNNMHCSI